MDGVQALNVAGPILSNLLTGQPDIENLNYNELCEAHDYFNLVLEANERPEHRPVLLTIRLAVRSIRLEMGGYGWRHTPNRKRLKEALAELPGLLETAKREQKAQYTDLLAYVLNEIEQELEAAA